MKHVLYLCFFASLQSCFAPLHTSYESARSLPKGEIQLTGSGSNTLAHFPFLLPTNQSLGGGIQFGLTDNIDVKIRHERFISLELQEAFSSKLDNEYSYTEIGVKTTILEDHLAMALQVGRYLGLTESGSILSINPQVILSMQANKHFEVTTIPNITILSYEGNRLVYPGIITGINVSTDINKWAVRPEIGIGPYFTMGVGAYVNL